MVLRNFFLLAVLLFLGNVVSGQSKKPSVSVSVHSKVGKDFSINADDTLRSDQKDVYHLRGAKIEKLFSDSQPKKDDRLPEHDFIIERSPDIKIQYSPSKSQL